MPRFHIERRDDLFGFVVYVADAFGVMRPILNKRGDVDVQGVESIEGSKRAASRQWGDPPRVDRRAEWAKPAWANMRQVGKVSFA